MFMPRESYAWMVAQSATAMAKNFGFSRVRLSQDLEIIRSVCLFYR